MRHLKNALRRGASRPPVPVSDRAGIVDERYPKSVAIRFREDSTDFRLVRQAVDCVLQQLDQRRVVGLLGEVVEQ